MPDGELNETRRRSCGTCDAYQHIEDRSDGGFGQCRLRPPRIFKDSRRAEAPVAGQPNYRVFFAAKFPIVNASWWCLEWRAGRARKSTEREELVLEDGPRLIYSAQSSPNLIGFVTDNNSVLTFQGAVEDLRVGLTRPGHYRIDRDRGLVQLGSAPVGTVHAVLQRTPPED